MEIALGSCQTSSGYWRHQLGQWLWGGSADLSFSTDRASARCNKPESSGLSESLRGSDPLGALHCPMVRKTKQEGPFSVEAAAGLIKLSGNFYLPS